MTEATDQIYGTLPASWKLTTIGRLIEEGKADLQTGPFGTALQASEYKPVGTPVIAVKHIGQNKILHDDDLPRVDADTRQRLSRYELRVNDIVFGRKGAVDRRARITELERGWLQGSDCIRLRIASPEIDSIYVSYILGSPQYQSWIIRNAGGSTMPSLNQSILSRIPLPLPPLEEQREIAYILGALDDKIELNRQMNATLEATARAVFKSWFVDFDPVRSKANGEQPVGIDAEIAALFPDSFEDSALGLIPEGWLVASLPEMIEINPARRLRSGELAPYLAMENMPTSSARAIDWEWREFGSGMRFQNGDVLLARITPCLENGKTAYVDFLEDRQIAWGSTEYIVFHSGESLPTEYAYFLARSDELRAFAIQNMTGTSGRQRVPSSAFADYLIPVPPREIACRFGEYAKNVMLQMKSHDEQSHTLTELRDALLSKLISGEITTSASELDRQ